MSVFSIQLKTCHWPQVWGRAEKISTMTQHLINSILESHVLTHWGRAMHICVSKLTIIGSDNGLSPGRRQAITWTNDGILLIGPLGTNFSEILSKIHTFSFKKMHLKTSSAKRRPFCLGLHVLSKNTVCNLSSMFYNMAVWCRIWSLLLTSKPNHRLLYFRHWFTKRWVFTAFPKKPRIMNHLSVLGEPYSLEKILSAAFNNKLELYH